MAWIGWFEFVSFGLFFKGWFGLDWVVVVVVFLRVGVAWIGLV